MGKTSKRKDELQLLLERRSDLTGEEYLTLLKQIRKNYTIKLAELSLSGETYGTGAIVNIIDKVHWLIDSMEPIKPKDKFSEDYGMSFETPEYNASCNN